MTRYKCKVTFKKKEKLPDFECEIESQGVNTAEMLAIHCARDNGYNGSVKQVTAREMSQSD